MLQETTPDGPAYAAIAHGFRRLISDGRIPLGTTLPSERELTRALGVSRTTVTRAYQTLKDSGFVDARHGSGSVASLPTTAVSRDALLQSTGAPHAGGERSLNLSCAAPSTPPGVSAAFEVAVSELPGYLHDIGYFPSGLPELRRAIADRYADRGLPTDPDQVIVTSGALGALAITLAAFGDTGDRAVLESPTYPNAIAALRRSGLRLAGADVTDHGWGGGAVSLTETVRQVRPAIAYLMPDWQNPTGQLMTDGQRQEVARALRDSSTLAVVDETTAELAIDDSPQPLPFAAHLADTITLGSASKTYWGGLRIGWIRAPRSRIPALLDARLVLDLGTPVVEQLALTHLMGRHEELIALRRQQLAEARSTLVRALAELLPSWSYRVPRGGLSLWCELPVPASSLLVSAAEQHGLQLAAGPLFAPEGGLERFIRVPYTLAPPVLDRATERLAEAWEETLGSHPRARRRTTPTLVT